MKVFGYFFYKDKLLNKVIDVQADDLADASDLLRRAGVEYFLMTEIKEDGHEHIRNQ